MVDIQYITDWFKTKLAEKLIVFSHTEETPTFCSSYAEFENFSVDLKAGQFYLVIDWQSGFATNSIQGENETDQQKLHIMVWRTCKNDEYADYITAQNEAKAIWFKQMSPRIYSKMRGDHTNFNFDRANKSYEMEQGVTENMYGMSIELLFKRSANYPINGQDEL